MSKNYYHNRFHKHIVSQKPNKLKVDDIAAAAKANTRKLCECPGSEPGKINLDVYAHLLGCHIQERLKTGRYTVNTSVTPRKITDGNSLGVAIGSEDF
jgi:hypothetical protein